MCHYTEYNIPYSGFCRRDPISAKHQFLCPRPSNHYGITWSRKIVACNGVWSWIRGWIIIPTDSVIRGYHNYKNVWRSVAMSSCTWFIQPSPSFGFLGQAAKQKCSSFEVVKQRHRIKKSHVRNYDTSSELKRKCKSLKFCEPDGDGSKNLRKLGTNRQNPLYGNVMTLSIFHTLYAQ